MALIKLNNQSLTAVSALPAAIPTGSVLQVVSQDSATQFQNSASGWLDIGLSATITPSSTSSKIFVLSTVIIRTNNGNNGSGGIGLRVANASNSVIIDTSGDVNPSGLAAYIPNGFYSISTTITKQILHSPNTTSAYTYKVQVNRGNAGDPPTINYNNGNGNFAPTSTLTLMEIAG